MAIVFPRLRGKSLLMVDHSCPPFSVRNQIRNSFFLESHPNEVILSAEIMPLFGRDVTHIYKG